MLGVLAFVALAGPATADRFDALGKLEKREAELVLKDRGLQLDPRPAGKTVRNLIIVNREVFSEDDGFLTWFNIFHRVTREGIIEREVLIRPGMVWDEELVEESARKIRDPFLSNMAVLLAVMTDAPGQVDLLVITRDVWSLRFNSNFQLQEDQLTLLSLSLAENNFLGWRKALSVAFNMDQGAFSFGPRYSDPNIAGSRLTLGVAADAIFNRESTEFEGSRSSVALTYPLWSLATPWGGSISVTHWDAPVRSFVGTGLRPYRPPEVPDTVLPWSYRYREFEADASATYSFGSTVKTRLSFGYSFFLTDAEHLDEFPDDEVLKTAFARDVFPRLEQSSALWFRYRLFTPTFRTYRDLRTFDLREDYLMGPDFSFRVTQALQLLGSDSDYTALSGGFEYAFDPGAFSYVKLSASWSGRLQHERLIDQRVQGKLFFASPKLWGALRVLVRASWDQRINETGNRFFALGGESGLRGHEVGELDGIKRLRYNIELRSRPWAWYFFRFGAVIFYDAGDAADRVEDLDIKHDLGFGVRILIPQINPYVLRVDWAFRTDQNPGIGRISAGFFQAF